MVSILEIRGCIDSTTKRDTIRELRPNSVRSGDVQLYMPKFSTTGEEMSDGLWILRFTLCANRNPKTQDDVSKPQIGFTCLMNLVYVI